MVLIARCVDANRKSCGLLLFFSLGSTVGEVDKRAESSGFAVWEWPADPVPLSITCARGEEEEGQRLFRDLLLAGPDGTCAIGEEKAPLLLLWTTPDFFFWGIITMTRKAYAVCEQASKSELCHSCTS